MKRYIETHGDTPKPLAEFHLVGDVVEIRWLVPGLDRFMALDSIMVDGRELTLADGRRFYDALERGFAGRIETVA